MHFKEDQCTYYTWVERISTNREIKQMIGDIKGICKGIEMVFKIEKNCPEMQFQNINYDAFRAEDFRLKTDSHSWKIYCRHI